MEPAESFVEALWHDLRDLEKYVPPAGIGVLVSARATYAKAMVIASGNWLERRTMAVLNSFVDEVSRSHEPLRELVRKKVVDRQFHTLFDWKSGRVDSFLKLFGKTLSNELLQAEKMQPDIANASMSFMKLVAERNVLAHAPEISQDPQFTPGDVRSMFYRASSWLSWIRECLIGAQAHSPWTETPPPQAAESTKSADEQQ